jgi:hypothetical protein
VISTSARTRVQLENGRNSAIRIVGRIIGMRYVAYV